GSERDLLRVVERPVDVGGRRPGERFAAGRVDASVQPLACGIGHAYTSTPANGSPPPTATSGITRWPGSSAMAAATSTYGCDGALAAGIMMNTRVEMVCRPKRNRFTGVDIGRSCSICSREPKKSAWLGHTVAHIGFLPTLVRS